MVTTPPFISFIALMMLFSSQMFAQEGLKDLKKKEDNLLANLIQVTKNIYSGGSPDNHEAFVQLKELGVKTIISVDGAKPLNELADEMSIRYVHIPIGYDGISDIQKATLSSVLVQCAPPYYFHCHHGKHRGPAAVASLLVLNNKSTLRDALDFMKLAGTSPHYKGLWNDVRNTIDQKDLPSPEPLQPVSKVSSMVESMTQIDITFEHLKALEKNNWQVTETTPDITATHQALLLLENYKELPREFGGENLTTNNATSSLFNKHLKQSTDLSIELESALRNNKLSQATSLMKNLRSSCIDCHSDFRD